MAKEDIVLTAPVSKVSIDPKWNSRFSVEDSSGEPDESTGLQGLADSIRSHGQDEPAIARLNKSGKGGPEYVLVTGFRRHAAIMKNAEKDGIKDPTIRLIVKDITEAEAFALNCRENVRENLSPPDTCNAILRMQELNPSMTEQSLANMMGKSQSYVNKMLTIGRGLKKNIMDQWRGAPKKLDLSNMLDIAKLDKGKQDEAYKVASVPKEKKETRGDAWVKGAVERAETVGRLFGQLMREEVIDVFNESDLFSADRIRMFVTGVKPNGTEKQVEKVCDAAMSAYAAERDRVDAPAEDDGKGGGTTTPKRTAKAKNGAVALA